MVEKQRSLLLHSFILFFGGRCISNQRAGADGQTAIKGVFAVKVSPLNYMVSLGKMVDIVSSARSADLVHRKSYFRLLPRPRPRSNNRFPSFDCREHRARFCPRPSSMGQSMEMDYGMDPRKLHGAMGNKVHGIEVDNCCLAQGQH